MDNKLITTIKVSKSTKKELVSLDFVGKEHTYNDVILELVRAYKDGIKKVDE